ncbi:MAG: lamin tail domain-containing protein [Haliscomenobacter sp.]|nr:lamin tail domain-containing protein [Haliscomenobacter sp.]
MFKKLVFAACCLALTPWDMKGQLTEDFTLPSLSAWSGDTAKFRVQAGRLQLFDPAPGPSNDAYLSLSAPTSREASTRWEFLAVQEFSASTSNYARIYLAADNPSLLLAQNGYYLQIGGIAGAEDALELYRLDKGVPTLLIRGTAGAVGGARAEVRARLARDTSGAWTMFADYTGGRDFRPEGQADDPSRHRGPFFGPACKYSSTRGQSFFFDDFLIDPLYQDKTPPELNEAAFQSPASLLLRFNEPLGQASASDPLHYLLDPGGIRPVSAVWSADDPALVLLSFPSPLENFKTYTLRINQLRDQTGNEAATINYPFTFLFAEAPGTGDLVFAEIMADPTPGQGALPETEYLELYNRSAKALRTEGLQLRVGSSAATFPAQTILPGAWVLVCAAADTADFPGVASKMALPSLPGLSNSGALIRLTAKTGETIDALTYASSWYRDPEKDDGGFSLERIDPLLASDCPQNWQVSLAAKGGTPGAPNSIPMEQADRQGPSLKLAIGESPLELRLAFNEKLQETSAASLAHYSIRPALPISQALVENEGYSVVLVLGQDLQPAQRYTVTVKGGLADCLGNVSKADQSLETGLPAPPAAGDLVVNEILFDPQTGGKDFVELYNPSNKLINLQGLTLRNEFKTGGTAETQIGAPYLLFPGRWVAYTPDTADLRSRYPLPDSAQIAQNDLPSLDAEEGNISLYDGAILLAAADYLDDYHHALLRSRKGVSLERINPEASPQIAANWHSASSASGYATPGYRNSQFFPFDLAPGSDGFFALPESTFSPDGDGYQDFLLLTYQASQPDYLVNIRIFDAQGREIKTLVQKELLANEGVYQWDGSTSEGAKAPIGIYIVWIEYFRPDGQKGQQKLVCVLAAKL